MRVVRMQTHYEPPNGEDQVASRRTKPNWNGEMDLTLKFERNLTSDRTVPNGVTPARSPNMQMALHACKQTDSCQRNPQLEKRGNSESISMIISFT
uniref:C2 domain-containing protein n=1 Tax=Heterorhabditis bacteriophora TaxID=37862 RepID=A0A1I7X933_HETBA